MDFNLTLDKYSVADLKNMFKLGECYVAADVDAKARAIRTQLVTEAMHPTLITNLTTFISGAKDLLMKEARDDLIPRPPILYVPSKTEEYVAGLVNPYERRQMTRCVNIDTLFRFNYSGTESTDFSYSFPETIKNAVTMQLTSIEIPNMIPAFSSKTLSNSFQLTVRNVAGDSVVTKIILIPDGSYTAESFETVMNNVLATQGFPYLMLTVTLQTRVEIKARLVTDGDSVYDPAGAYYNPNFEFDVDFLIEGRDLMSTAGWNMGFRAPSYVAKSVTSYETGVTYPHCISSESSFGSSVDNYVFLEVDDFQNNFQTDTLISATSNAYLGKNLLARVVLNSGLWTIVTSFASDGVFKKREYFGPVRLERLHVRLLNRFGDVIDLSRNDFSFVLEFKTIYS